MKVRFINNHVGPISLPGPLPRLKIKDDITVDIVPEAYDRYRKEIQLLVSKGLISHSYSVISSILQATSTNNTTTTSDKYKRINGMILTPGAGDYMALFDTSLSCSLDNTSIYVAIYANDVRATGSKRVVNLPSDRIAPLSISIPLIGVGAGHNVEIKWYVDGGTGTARQRNLTLLRTG